jgi:3-deoxy-D-manno-octulosonic acid kinase
LSVQAVTITNKSVSILYDAVALAYAHAYFFEPTELAARGWLRDKAKGRGHAYFFRYRGTDYVLRHYRRGGRMARLDDRYLWTGLGRTRAWREWRLLARLQELKLPAPRPVAARTVRNGCWYRADLIIVRCSGLSLAARLSEQGLPVTDWAEIGRVIRRFHDAGVWHADLNAHNVLLDANGAVTLIDFDRARFRSPARHWREANLARLLRSLNKLKRLSPKSNFCARDFELLRQGYNSVTSAPQPIPARRSSPRPPNSKLGL